MQTPRDRKQKFTVILKDDIFKEFMATLGYRSPRRLRMEIEEAE